MPPSAEGLGPLVLKNLVEPRPCNSDRRPHHVGYQCLHSVGRHKLSYDYTGGAGGREQYFLVDEQREG